MPQTKKRSEAVREEFTRDYIDRLLLNGFMKGEAVPLRANEVLERAGIDELNAMTVRALLLTSPEKFLQQDRRWMPLFRKTSAQTPILSFIERIVGAMGAPVHVDRIAAECAGLYRRSHEYYETVLPRVAGQSETLFCTSSGWVGLRKWVFEIIDIESIPYEWNVESERRRAMDDALFYNFLSWSEVEPYLDLASKLDWQLPETAVEFLKKVKQPLDNRIIGFMGWHYTLDPDPHWIFPYSPVALFEAVQESGEFTWGPDRLWHGTGAERKWLEAGLQIAKEKLTELPEEETQPLEVRPDEVDRVVAYILKVSGVTHATRILQEIFEVPPNSKTFQDDLYTLINALWADGRVQWLGYDRFGQAKDVPGYVETVPIILEYPEVEPIINEETGEAYDVLISEEGFPKSLVREMKDPRAQDVLDEEPPRMEMDIPVTLRLVLKSHHREIGTFPLCQIPLGFFSDDPAIQSLTFIDEQDHRHEVWLNHETRLIYGLFDRFAELNVISGATFHLTKADRPDTYKFEFTGESDPLLYLSNTRYDELLDLQAKADELSTYQILVEVLQKHTKGADFLTLLTEVNIVRRTQRELIASLLSAYPCFEQKKGSTVWHLEADKVGQPIPPKARKHLLG
jgi:hypothetical protein